MQNITIQHGGWTADFAPRFGGRMIRLRWNGFDLLRHPETEDQLREGIYVYGIPVLLPPNRIDAGTFKFHGRRYQLPLNEPWRNNHLHGVVATREWELRNRSANAVLFGCGVEESAGLGVPFDVEILYEFSGSTMVQRTTVRNGGELPMPFGIGFHTVFRSPRRARLTAAEFRWEIVRPRFLASGRKLPWETFNPNEWFDPSEQVISCHFPMETKEFDGKPFRGALLDYDGLRVRYESGPEFRHWCLWNHDPSDGFLCPEPMSWLVNAPNLPLPPEETGFQTIAPHGSWNGINRISVEELQ